MYGKIWPLKRQHLSQIPQDSTNSIVLLWSKLMRCTVWKFRLIQSFKTKLLYRITFRTLKEQRNQRHLLTIRGSRNLKFWVNVMAQIFFISCLSKALVRISTISQFHQHFTSSFCAKTLQSQTVPREKLRKTRLY